MALVSLANLMFQIEQALYMVSVSYCVVSAIWICGENNRKQVVKWSESSWNTNLQNREQ